MQDYRSVIEDQIKLTRTTAVISAVAIVLVPEAIIYFASDAIARLLTGSNDVGSQAATTVKLVVLAMPVIPLLLIAAFVNQAIILNAAMYQLMLKVDENLEKLTKRV